MQNKLLYFGGNFKNSIFSIYLLMLFCRVCVCVNMCVCVCVHGHTYTYRYTWKPEVSVRCSLHSLSTLFFWEPKLAILPRLAGCKLPDTGVTDVRWCAWSLCGSRRSQLRSSCLYSKHCPYRTITSALFPSIMCPALGILSNEKNRWNHE